MSNKDDLLNIENGSNQNNMKKILIYVAIAFLVFVIGVIGFALFQNSRNSEKNTIIPPEVKSQPKQENLFQQIPIENENTQNTQQNAQKPQKNMKEAIIQNSIQNKPNKSEIKQKEIQTVPSKPKQKEHKILKPIKKEIKTTNKAIKTKKYYIQVAALLRHKKPSKKFLHIITKSGYKYKFFVTYTKLKGEKIKVTKVLIGPFKNEKVARKALKKIKADITQNAFLFKVK